MLLSCGGIAGRLWDGVRPVDIERDLAISPVPDIEQFRKKNGASLDLRLGRWFRTMQYTRIKSVSLMEGEGDIAAGNLTKEHYIRFNDDFVLHPGQFALGITLEWMRVPSDLAGYVTGKSAWGRRGLIIETAAGIHPGFTGCLALELVNVGTAPVLLNPGMEVCQIFFHTVEEAQGGAATQFIGYRKPRLGRVAKDAVVKALAKPFFQK